MRDRLRPGLLCDGIVQVIPSTFMHERADDIEVKEIGCLHLAQPIERASDADVNDPHGPNHDSRDRDVRAKAPGSNQPQGCIPSPRSAAVHSRRDRPYEKVATTGVIHENAN